MNVRGLVLIGFSAACLGVAGLGHHAEKKRAMSMALTKTMLSRDCMNEGFKTPGGRVGCITQVSFPLFKGLLGGGPSYRGGGAFGGR